MVIKKFLSIYPNSSTVAVYRAAIFDFFDCLHGRVRKGKYATEEERKEYERLAKQYFEEPRDHFEDMIQFLNYMHNRPPTGAKAKIAGVLEFLRYYDVEFTQKQRRQLSTKMPKGKTSRTVEQDIDVPMLKKLLNHMDLTAKAVTLVLASSGMRPNEPFQVLLSDVNLDTTPAEIIVRGENSKEGDTRRVFLSQEAKETVLEWLNVRDKYLEKSQKRSNGLVKGGIAPEKALDDERLFPFTVVNFREAWNNTLKKAGLWNKDSSTGRTQIRVHGLRKFFRSQLALSCPVDIVEALMGHQGYLTNAYRRYTTKQMGEYYLKAEHHVTVSGTADLHEIKDRLQDTQAAVKGYKDIITEQAVEITQLKERFSTQERQLEGIRDRYGELEAKGKVLDALTERMQKMEEFFEKESKNPTPVHDRKASFTRWDDE
jgi:integrase